MTTVKWERELTMTEPEESVLVKMAQFFIENGWVDADTEKEFDTLIEKYVNPPHGTTHALRWTVEKSVH